MSSDSIFTTQPMRFIVTFLIMMVGGALAVLAAIQFQHEVLRQLVLMGVMMAGVGAGQFYAHYSSPRTRLRAERRRNGSWH